MAKPRVTATDRLQNVIEVVELGRRTGLLSVERGTAAIQEEGAIYFMNGHAIYAAVASLRGSEALMILGRWGECRFAFDPNAPRPTPNVSGVLPSLEMVDPAHGARSSPSLSAPSGPFGAPSGPFGASSGPFISPSGPLAPPTGPFAPSADSSNPWRSIPGAPSGSMPNAAPDPRVRSQPPFPPMTSPNVAPRETGPSSAYQANPLLLRRPHRAPDVRDLMAIVTTYNLSRGHRTILLLADGEHSVLDLARLSSKSVDEVVQLLGDLEGFGLVYYHPS
jgi:hypothetical protein